MNTAAFYVEKGGVAKTTSAAHMAVAASQDHDLDVVLLDLAGTQNDLAAHFGLREAVAEPDAPISAVFGENWDVIAANIPDVLERMTHATGEGPDLIPADQGLTAADNNLASIPVEDRYLKLRAFLEDHLAERYDLAIVDLPGKEDNIALSGLVAAEHVVAPARPGRFERNQLEKLQQDLERVRDDLRAPLDRAGAELGLTMILPAAIDRRTTQGPAFVDDLQDRYGDLVGEPIARSANISRLQGDGQTLFDAADAALYDTGKRAREAYRQNTTTLLDRL